MAPRRSCPGRLRSYGDGSSPCTRLVRRHAGEDRSKRCSRHRPARAPGLVQGGPRQGAFGTGNTSPPEGSAIPGRQAHRNRELDARGTPQLRPQDGPGVAPQLGRTAQELAAGVPALEIIVSSLLKVRDVLLQELRKLDRTLIESARTDPVVRMLMTAPGVGAIVALTFKSA